MKSKYYVKMGIVEQYVDKDLETGMINCVIIFNANMVFYTRSPVTLIMWFSDLGGLFALLNVSVLIYLWHQHSYTKRVEGTIE